LFPVDRPRRHRTDLDPDRPNLAQLRLQPGQIPAFEIVAGGVLVDQPLDHPLELVTGDVGHVAPLEDLAAIFVDDTALLVHHVVVLEHPFADQEVLFLDLLLRPLDRFRQHFGLQRHLPALLRPASAIRSPSFSACSGLALSTACSTPCRFNSPEIISETSTETVPTRIGWPFSWRAKISSSTAFHLPSLVLKIWSLWSAR